MNAYVDLIWRNCAFACTEHPLPCVRVVARRLGFPKDVFETHSHLIIPLEASILLVDTSTTASLTELLTEAIHLHRNPIRTERTDFLYTILYSIPHSLLKNNFHNRTFPFLHAVEIFYVMDRTSRILALSTPLKCLNRLFFSCDDGVWRRCWGINHSVTYMFGHG